MKIIIWFSWFKRIIMRDFEGLPYQNIQDFVLNVKKEDFVVIKTWRGTIKCYPTSEIRLIKIKK